MTRPADTLGAVALRLMLNENKDPPEIARLLTAQHSAHGRTITPDEARELYQDEFRKGRVGR
ncbi:hypothetical protein ASG43_03100 [Aureimonas sp. Leaf454]|uniref:hypothetical protein n=1 Tax=Aureimonas sp. Leaf454 TaxID=1736381 RepID=UPI0006F468A6|nr:hypothetical protein [Aureimonas sp. Leaf454]KQT54586.1 hypothetical protein ASG43_03100 [Aureimonas sp. Leaf454]